MSKIPIGEVDKSGVLSVKDLFSPERQAQFSATAKAADLLSTLHKPVKLDDEAYVVPKYSWKQP